MSKIYLIAEIGINHNGDMSLAKELIDKAANAECDAVKFQKRTISQVYTKEELDANRESPWGTTNRQQKEGLEFNVSQYKKLEMYSKSLGLDFIVSCWDINSVQVIEDSCDVKYHKIASAMLTDLQFLQKLNETGKPIIVSTGLSTQEEVDKALEILDNVEYVLACTSTYPTKVNELNLKYIETLKSKYPDLKVGFSNHYNGLDACVGATALGSKCIEFHITKDRAMYGSDQPASIENIHSLTDSIRKMEQMVGDGVKKVYESEKPIIDKLRKVSNIC
tara:strand:+ start:26479 stop:27312 length:834 start_codon:yes stop_codon:yes gene_type:complete